MPSVSRSRCSMCRLIQTVAVGIQQAFGGGQQRSLAVGFDAAAFQNQVDGFARSRAERAQRVQSAGDLVVEIAGIFAAPAVETEIQQHRPAIAIDGDRAMVARPDIVGRREVKPAAFQIGAGGGQQAAHVLAMRGSWPLMRTVS